MPLMLGLDFPFSVPHRYTTLRSTTGVDHLAKKTPYKKNRYPLKDFPEAGRAPAALGNV